MCFVLDKTHEGASAAARNQSRLEQTGGGGRGKGKGKQGYGSRRGSSRQTHNWATEPLLKHLDVSATGIKWGGSTHLLRRAQAASTVETGTVVHVVNERGGGGAPGLRSAVPPSGSADSASGGSGPSLSPSLSPNGTTPAAAGHRGEHVAARRPTAKSMELITHPSPGL